MPRKHGAHRTKKRARPTAGGEESSDEDDHDGSDPAMPTRHGNRIFFHCSVNRKTVLRLVELLSEVTGELASLQCKRTVWIYIHSEGGDLYAGISGMTHIRSFPGTVHTVVDGFVASAATLLLLAGERRHIHAHSGVLIHQLTTGFWGGKYEDLRDEYHNCERLMQQLRDIYVSQTAMPLELVLQHLRTEVFLDADECVKYNIVQRVIRPPQLPPPNGGHDASSAHPACSGVPDTAHTQTA